MIGIIPAAGHSTRMYGLPKFLLPIADSYLLEHLQSRMHRTGAEHVYFGARPVNYGMPALRPERINTYWVETETMNETVLAARQYAGKQDVLFGMPDTYWTDGYVYQRLAEVLNDSVDTIASVGVWQTPDRYRGKRGMVRIGSNGRILEVVDKPTEFPELQWMLSWGAISWDAEFWDYIKPEDAHVGFALQRAIDDGQKVQGVIMDGQFWDCGTPDEYFDCIRSLEKIKA